MGWRDKLKRFVSKAASAVKSFVTRPREQAQQPTSRLQPTQPIQSAQDFKPSTPAPTIQSRTTTSNNSFNPTAPVAQQGGAGSSEVQRRIIQGDQFQPEPSVMDKLSQKVQTGMELGRSTLSGGTTPDPTTGTFSEQINKFVDVGMTGTAATGGLTSGAKNLKTLSQKEFWKTFDIMGKGRPGNYKWATKLTDGLAKPGVITDTGVTTKTGTLFQELFKKLTTTVKNVKVTNHLTGVTTIETIESTSMVKPVAIIGGTIAGLWYLASQTLGGQNFGKFMGKEEGGGVVGTTVWMAQSSDNYAEYLNARALQNEVLAPDNLNGISSLIPFKNVADGVDQYAETALKSGEIMDRIMIDREVQLGNLPANFTMEDGREAYAAPDGTIYPIANSEDEFWAQKRQEEIDQQKQITDYRISENKKYTTWKIKAERDGDSNAAKIYADAAAAAWEFEKEQMEFTRQFWIDYRIMLMQMQQNNAPSNLKFGLL